MLNFSKRTLRPPLVLPRDRAKLHEMSSWQEAHSGHFRKQCVPRQPMPAHVIRGLSRSDGRRVSHPPQQSTSGALLQSPSQLAAGTACCIREQRCKDSQHMIQHRLPGQTFWLSDKLGSRSVGQDLSENASKKLFTHSISSSCRYEHVLVSTTVEGKSNADVADAC